MGAVWLAERISDVGVSKLVALKMMSAGVGAKGAYQTFLREARVSMSMNHPNVVQVFDAGVHDRQAWLDLEYVEGVDLSRIGAKLRADGRLPSEAAILHLARSLLRGLAHAHGLRSAPGGAGVVHRDVSPQNVLVSLHGQVKLNDFGIARILETVPSETSPMGKLRYMAPEQARGHPTAPSDLFGAGAVLHELANGRKFRDHIPSHAMLKAAMNGTVAPIVRPLAPAVLHLLHGLVAADARQRFQTAEAALDFMQQHGLLVEATTEWAALSAAASDTQQRRQAGPSEQSLSGSATEVGTGALVDSTPATRTGTAASKRGVQRWLVPLAVVFGALGLALPVAMYWNAWTRSMRDRSSPSSPATTAESGFHTGLPQCDRMLEVFRNCERAPGEPTYTERALRRMERNLRKQAGDKPAWAERSCAASAAKHEEACRPPGESASWFFVTPDPSAPGLEDAPSGTLAAP